MIYFKHTPQNPTSGSNPKNITYVNMQIGEDGEAKFLLIEAEYASTIELLSSEMEITLSCFLTLALEKYPNQTPEVALRRFTIATLLDKIL